MPKKEIGTYWNGKFEELFPMKEAESKNDYWDSQLDDDLSYKCDEGKEEEKKKEENKKKEILFEGIPKITGKKKKYRKVKIIDDSYSWGEAGEYLDPSRKKTEKEKKQVRKNKKWLDLICKASDLEACQKWLAYGNDFCKYGSVREFRIREAERIITKETNL